MGLEEHRRPLSTQPHSIYILHLSIQHHHQAQGINDTYDSTVQHRPAKGQRGDCFSPSQRYKSSFRWSILQRTAEPRWESLSEMISISRGRSWTWIFLIHLWSCSPRGQWVEDSLISSKKFSFSHGWDVKNALEYEVINRMHLVFESKNGRCRRTWKGKTLNLVVLYSNKTRLNA